MVRNRLAKTFIHAFIYVMLLLFITPFFLMVLNSFKTTQQFVTSPFSLPKTINFSNYSGAFVRMNFLRAITNSAIITSLSVILIIITASMSAHFLARNKGRASSVIYAVLVASMIVPFQAVMIPLVSIYGNTLRLMNNKWILIAMYLGFGQAFAVFVFHGFIKTIPLELEETALIDGCTKMQSFYKVVFPLLTPIIMTVLVLDILWIWNDYLLPALVLLSPKERTLPLSTYAFFNSYSVDYAPLMAGLVLSILPVLLVYIFTQRKIIEGVVQGAIK